MFFPRNATQHCLVLERRGKVLRKELENARRTVSIGAVLGEQRGVIELV